MLRAGAMNVRFRYTRYRNNKLGMYHDMLIDSYVCGVSILPISLCIRLQTVL